MDRSRGLSAPGVVAALGMPLPRPSAHRSCASGLATMEDRSSPLQATCAHITQVFPAITGLLIGDSLDRALQAAKQGSQLHVQHRRPRPRLVPSPTAPSYGRPAVAPPRHGQSRRCRRWSHTARLMTSARHGTPSMARRATPPVSPSTSTVRATVCLPAVELDALPKPLPVLTS